MSYEQSLKAAGATVLEYQSFGSYQGNWWAKVRYDGRVGWVYGSYGSCSGCDSFQSEFGYDNDDEGCEEHRYDKVADCRDCTEHGEAYRTKLADFGRGYLDAMLTQAEAEKEAAENLEWDMGAQEMLDFIKANAC